MIKKEKMSANRAIRVSRNKIYIYETPNNLDTRGYVKIGQTERDAQGRVSGQTGTAMVRANLLAEFEAVDDSGQVFSDKEIHQFLLRKGIPSLKHYESGKPSEWFKIGVEDVKKVIENRQHFMDEFQFLKKKPSTIELYPSQQEALDRTYERWLISRQDNTSRNSNINKFLWNAKPRFGKTLAAYKFAEKIKAKNVLVMTQRTSISNAWFADYHDYIRNSADSSYEFGSSKDNQIENEAVVKARALSEHESAKIAHDDTGSLIYYTTLANIKGRNEVGEFKKKNQWIFGAHWDLVILDETHEGTTTNPMMHVLDMLDFDFLLELSGTPFRKMTETQGYTAENTYSWSYIEEQEAKENWDYAKGKNPYINLPWLNIYTFQVPASVRVASDLSEYSFDFNEFWRVHAGEFVHNEEIDNFLDMLSNQKARRDDEQTQYYPFADENTREQLRHTFWKLPSTAAVNLLEKKLSAHSYFSQYDVISAADSANGQNSMKAEKQVKAAIGKNGLKTKTITLSVDMLTTGTTIKEWTGVLMLDNSASASKYIQTAFRAQTPWSQQLETGETFTKTDAFVFDFNPDRVLKVAEEYANMDADTGVEIVGNSSGDRQAKTQVLLNFLPVIAMNEDGDMRYIDAKEAMNIINYTHARKIVDEGFMSNNLFNVKALFRMKGESYERMREIVGELPSVPIEEKKKSSKKRGEPLPEENPEDAFEVEKQKVISESGLGEKKFAAIESASDQAGDNADLVIEIASKQSHEEITASDIEKFNEAKKPYDEVRKHQKTEEDKFRDHLRGFARTIPVLLMAYAHEDMNFQNFEKKIPHADFKQVTGITKEQFEMLRQARDETGEPIFVESAFNSAIHEFLKRKRATERYYTGENTDDIYDYIPSQENNRVFTPKSVVNMMLDALEAENPGIFKSDKVKLLDPYVKSGNFLAEAAKRFYTYSKDKDIHRIIRDQLFGIAPFDIYARLAQETVFGFADNKFKYEVMNRNIRPESRIHELMKQGKFEDVIKEHFGNMKFDVVIGNPPYQDEIKGRSEQPPIYHHFIDGAYKVSDKVCLITPARFLFNVGGTPKAWNEKMLDDKHLKVAFFEQKSDNIFPGTDIKGGVAITYRDTSSDFGKIGTFTHFDQLNSITKKVLSKADNMLADIYFSNTAYKYSPLFFSENPGFETRVSGGSKRYMASSAFEKFPEAFLESPENDNYVKIIGRKNSQRTTLFFNKKYVNPPENFYKFKVLLPGSNGSGAIGEALSTPLIGEPLVGHTETFISFGAFETREEAENLLKYTKTKFARTMLGVRKVTQGNKNAYVWGLVPLQNFTASSDIDWAASVSEIDRQLYKKYGFDEKEIAFIEEKVREMQ
ncbi:MAG: Eco57I restriction-modification methylase domain-containing protein [Candidatus Saccharibacteria bacterium]|nr:Eco57I restriction-modification methylase domain-containing protein [Candidatus Saccharibacteria bacterium]